MASIAEACARIEANHPKIKRVYVLCCSTEGVEEEIFLKVRLLLEAPKYEGYDEVEAALAPKEVLAPESYDYNFDDVDVWRRLGKAIQGIHLEKFGFRFYDQISTLVHDVNPPAACLDALFGQIKYARSIDHFRILLAPNNQLQMFDFGQLLQSNLSLQVLDIESKENLTADQFDVLYREIAGRRLKNLDIYRCDFANDGSLERLLSACTNIEEMVVQCEFTSQVSAFSMLLRDPTTVMLRASLYRSLSCREDSNEIMLQVISNLAGNTTLKELVIQASSHDKECINKVLCDATSIRSIYNSNHTLEKFDGGWPLWSGFTYECLTLNKNAGKAQVVRNKILKYYFIGDFDISLFVNMPVSAMPEVISQIRSETTQSAIFRLLKCIPELCDVTSRYTFEQPSKTKRQRIHV